MISSQSGLYHDVIKLVETCLWPINAGLELRDVRETEDFDRL